MDSSFQIFHSTSCSFGFSWDFPQLPENNVVSSSIPFGDLSICFKVELETSTDQKKLVGLVLQMTGDINGATGCLCGKATLLNGNASRKSANRYISHRFTEKSSGQINRSFNAVGGLMADFAMNNRDPLYIHGDVLLLHDYGCFASHEKLLTEDLQEIYSMYSMFNGIYKGQYTWMLKNYDLVQERFKKNGMLASSSFPIGKRQHFIQLENWSTQEKDELLSMRLPSSSYEAEWCVVHVEMRKKKQCQSEKVCTACGRLGFDLKRIEVMKISEFEERFVMEENPVELIVCFTALKEKHKHAEEMINKKELVYYEWSILNFSTIAKEMEECILHADARVIRSERIAVSDTGIYLHLSIWPWGTGNTEYVAGDTDYVAGDTDYVALGVDAYIVSTPIKVASILIEIDFTMQSLGRNSEKRKQRIIRLPDRTCWMYTDFILRSDVYLKSDGEVFDAPLLIKAKFHRLKEDLICMPRDNSRIHLIWHVDNFLSKWEIYRRTEEKNTHKEIVSDSVDHEGFKFSISISLGDDGFVCGELKVDQLPEKNALISADLAITPLDVNQIEWKRIAFWSYEVSPLIQLGKLLDILEDGFVREDDTLIFGCLIGKPLAPAPIV